MWTSSCDRTNLPQTSQQTLVNNQGFVAFVEFWSQTLYLIFLLMLLILGFVLWVFPLSVYGREADLQRLLHLMFCYVLVPFHATSALHFIQIKQRSIKKCYVKLWAEYSVKLRGRVCVHTRVRVGLWLSQSVGSVPWGQAWTKQAPLAFRHWKIIIVN